jgi:hypothetical protein
MRTFKIILALFVAISFAIFYSFTHSPLIPFYDFKGPRFSSLIPFSINELKIIKERKIKSIRKFNNEYLTTYRFNNEGALFQEEEFRIRKVFHDQLISRTSYKYSENGKLQVKFLINNKKIEQYDSLSYDADGRITSYYSHFKGLSEKYINYNLNLTEKQNGIFILSDIDRTKYYLDSLNQIIKICHESNIDSISFDYIDKFNYRKLFWFKYGENANWKLGREETYNGQLIEKYINYSYSDNNAIQKKLEYYYNSTNNLIHLEDSNKNSYQTFITYKYYGLANRILVLVGDKVDLTYFEYEL